MAELIEYIDKFIDIANSFVNSGLVEKFVFSIADTTRFTVLEINSFLDAIIEWITTVV